MAGVLGVATVAYLPYCFFNLLSPVISLIYGFTGFRIEHVRPAAGCPDPRRCGPDRLEARSSRRRSRMTAADAQRPQPPEEPASAGSRCRRRTRSCSS